MVYDSKNDQLIAGMEMQDLEAIGVIKFDILGIAMLDKIMTIQDLLKEGVLL
jgi:DNA polymerase III alpha subunit